MTCESSAELLETGWNSLTGQALSAQIRERMLVYLEQLQLWNKSYNLTAIREPGQMVVRHILDSLTLLPWIEGPLLDVGTGAGLPGIPLAIARPELDVTLIDSAGKKVRFLSHVQRSLSLANVHPIHGRVEEHVAQPYHRICSRAFSSLADFALACSHLMGPKTRLLAMKGRFPDQEIEQLPDAFTVESVEKLSVPGLQEDRHLVIMSVKP